MYIVSKDVKATNKKDIMLNLGGVSLLNAQEYSRSAEGRIFITLSRRG